MKSIKLNFNIEIESLEKKLLRVKLFINDLPELDTLHLFKSKSKIENVNSFVPMSSDQNFLYFKIDKKDSILFEYIVKLEDNSKFGKIGSIDSNILAFAGEQVFILPYQAINLGKNQENFEFEISVDYNLNSFKNKLIPFENNNSTHFTTDSWSDIFSFVKSSYVFSNTLNTKSYDKLCITCKDNIDPIIVDNIKSIYSYFESIFNDSVNVDVVILPYEEKKFAGSSDTIICSTFDLNDKRDFKLLSKRLFNAFIQSKIKSHVLFAPPNLWIVEGLCVYYENKALAHIDEASKERLNLSFEKEYQKLYRLYIHSMSTNEKIYNFPPVLDGSIKSFALIEYFYNIKAPLLIKLFEDNAINPDSNSIIKYLCSLEDANKFSQPHMFEKILANKVHMIAKNYIFNVNKIPLDIDIKGDLEEIKSQILEFENTMAMYFAIDKKNISLQTNTSNKKAKEAEKEVASTT